MTGRVAAAVLVALTVVACGPQSDNGQGDAARRDQVAGDRRPLIDVCAVARHPERFNGQRARLSAIVVQDIEGAYLTWPSCMERRWDGKVWIDESHGWDFSQVGPAVMEARRRSTDSHGFAARAEFEGVVRAQRRAIPLNETGAASEFVAMFRVERVDQVRLMQIPAAAGP